MQICICVRETDKMRVMHFENILKLIFFNEIINKLYKNSRNSI